jgi:hypothetical protein
MRTRTFPTALLVLFAAVSGTPAGLTSQSDGPVRPVLEFFEKFPGDSSSVLRALRPEPASSAVRRHVLATLPTKGELRPQTRETEKLARLKSVFVYHERDGVFDTKLIDVPQAAVALHGRSILLISRPAVRLLSEIELQAVAAHEIGHDYFWDEYEQTRTDDDFRARQELELKCDGIAVLTLLGLGLDPSAVPRAMRKLTAFNASLGAVVNGEQYPDMDDRLRFARALTSMRARSMWRLHIRNPYLRDAARRTLEEAARRLSFPKCREVLSHFVDNRGRDLHAKLMELEKSPSDYLRLIVFEDGETRAQCRRDGILAFTSPGSRVIYLCGQDFVRATRRAPNETVAVVIHEMLHSLGLGENPPSSREITFRVEERCGIFPGK